MNISINTNLHNQNLNIPKRQSFGSAGEVVSQGLRYLSVNESIGATLVDFFSMALPRTIVDSTRGLDAGIETGIRENSGTANHVMIGTIGGAAAFALAPKFNKNYDVLSHTIFANNETIDILGKIWHEDFAKFKDKTDNSQQKAFFSKALKRISGLNSHDGESATWIELKQKTIDELTKTFLELSADDKLTGKRIPKDKLEYMKTLIVSDTGAEKSFRISSTDNSKTVEFAINSFLDDLFALGRTFSKEKVAKAFESSINDFNSNTFIKELKSLKMRSTFLALGISSAIGASVQPFNRWLTKKRTGSDGFVGVANNPNVTDKKKADISTKFIAAKCIAAASILALCLGSISTNIKEIPNKLQFKGKIPILSHFKLVYGFTIASRFLAARSSDELRESCFKDFLGFANWLILGGFVSKGIATMLDKKGLLNSTTDGSKKGFVDWLKNKSVKTVDEVLQKDLIANGIETVKDGKAISYKELLKKAKELGMTDTLKKIKYLNYAQAAGYIYSGVVLGYLIPKLNIKMTEYNNRKQEKKAAKLEELAIKQQEELNKNKPVNNSTKVVFSTFMKQLNIN